MAGRLKVEVVDHQDESERYAVVFEDGKMVLNRLNFDGIRTLVHLLINASFEIGTTAQLLRG